MGNNQGTRSYVIDCNVAIKWFLIKEDSSEEALSFLIKATAREILLFAPTILAIEFANVLTKHNKQKSLDQIKCKKHFDQFKKVCDQKVITLITIDDKEEMFKLALDETISYYDAEYLYLSKKLKFPLISYDKKLKKIATK